MFIPFGLFGGKITEPPVNTVAPVVSGGKSVGLTFATTNGAWTGSPAFTYQWTRDASDIGGATSSTYVMSASDIGTAIGCTVTGSNSAGTASANSSNTISGISWLTSVTPFSITIASTATSGTATISAVGANSFIVYNGFTTTNSSVSVPDGELGRAELTNTTTVTAYRNTGTSGQTTTVTGTVIDPGADLVDSIQAGTITLTAAGSNTATISSVDTTRSVVFFLGNTTAEVDSTNTHWKGGVTLTNSTTVTANVNSAGSVSTTFGYVVVQFKAQAIVRRQQISAQFSSTTSAENDRSITAVTMANSIIAYGGNKCSSTSFANCQNYLQLTSTTNVAMFRDGTTSTSITPYYTVLEFISGVLKSCQRGAITVDSVTSNTATISSIDTTKALVNFTGQTANGTGPREVWADAVLTDATTVTAAKNTAGTTKSIIGYEVWEFN